MEFHDLQPHSFGSITHFSDQIHDVSHQGMTITIWIQTVPSQQWAVGREYRLRVRQALAEHGIDIGTPRQTYQLEPDTSTRNGHHLSGDSETVASG